MSANLIGDISMCTSAEVLNGRILRAIEVVRSTLKGLPEGESGVSTFQVVTVLTDVEEALLGMRDAPDTSKSGAIEPHQGPPIAVTTRPQPDAETVAPSIPASDVESTIDQDGDFVIGVAPEPKEKQEEKPPADNLAGRHRSQTLAELARQKTQKFHADREKAAKSGRKSSKDDSEQTAAQRIRAAQRSTGL
jgi:type IV secretory pathway VirB10-like protein